jgi:acetolactate synthase-1/2/3 large subunit
MNQCWCAQSLTLKGDEGRIHISGGYGIMGCGLPYAIGSCIAKGRKPVYCISGDGGFQMNIQELGTIMEQGTAVKMILLNNNYLGNVRQWQELFFDHRYSWTPMLNPDYSMIANGYGIPSRLVIEREELDEAIREMLSSPGPYLLHVAIKEEANVMPMTPPGATVSEMIFE